MKTKLFEFSGWRKDEYGDLRKNINDFFSDYQNKTKDRNLTILELETLVGKYIGFESRTYSTEVPMTTTTTLHHGTVKKVGYDNDGKNKIAYVSLDGENWISIRDDSEIVIYKIQSDANKFGI